MTHVSLSLVIDRTIEDLLAPLLFNVGSALLPRRTKCTRQRTVIVFMKRTIYLGFAKSNECDVRSEGRSIRQREREREMFVKEKMTQKKLLMYNTHASPERSRPVDVSIGMIRTNDRKVNCKARERIKMPGSFIRIQARTKGHLAVCQKAIGKQENIESTHPGWRDAFALRGLDILISPSTVSIRANDVDLSSRLDAWILFVEKQRFSHQRFESLPCRSLRLWKCRPRLLDLLPVLWSHLLWSSVLHWRSIEGLCCRILS